jgi:hypothetical protein
MNKDALKSTAKELRDKLDFYVQKDAAAAHLLAALQILLSKAELEQIEEAMEPRDIPGYKIFTETNLQEYTDLEAAYTNFYMELTQGRESEIYKIIRDRMNKR